MRRIDLGHVVILITCVVYSRRACVTPCTGTCRMWTYSDNSKLVEQHYPWCGRLLFVHEVINALQVTVTSHPVCMLCKV